jgi:hypothetical protein
MARFLPRRGTTLLWPAAFAIGHLVQPAAAPAAPDLAVLDLRVGAPGARVGRCNGFVVEVRNSGGAPAAPTRLRLSIWRPGQPQAPADSRTLSLGELRPGEQRTLSITGMLLPEPGPWRITALADADRTLTEADKRNNEHTLELGGVPALCQL